GGGERGGRGGGGAGGERGGGGGGGLEGGGGAVSPGRAPSHVEDSPVPSGRGRPGVPALGELSLSLLVESGSAAPLARVARDGTRERARGPPPARSRRRRRCAGSSAVGSATAVARAAVARSPRPSSGRPGWSSRRCPRRVPRGGRGGGGGKAPADA